MHLFESGTFFYTDADKCLFIFVFACRQDIIESGRFKITYLQKISTFLPVDIEIWTYSHDDLFYTQTQNNLYRLLRILNYGFPPKVDLLCEYVNIRFQLKVKNYGPFRKSELLECGCRNVCIQLCRSIIMDLKCLTKVSRRYDDMFIKL